MKLFLKKPAISLEEAATEILKQSGQEFLRSKIRRLYDIVNVFKSLHLVKKIILPNKKTGFKWLGVEKLKKYVDSYSSAKEDILSEANASEEFKTPQKSNIEGSKSFFMDIIEKRVGYHRIDELSEVFSEHIFNTKSVKCFEMGANQNKENTNSGLKISEFVQLSADG